MQAFKTTEEKIFYSLHELMEKNAFEAITVQNIVENCGLTKPTFYRHFSDKYDLLAWSIIEMYRCLTPAKDELDHNQSNYRIYQLIQQDIAFYQNAFRYNKQNNLTELIINRMYSTNYDYCANLCVDNDELLLLPYAVKFYCYGVIYMLKEWIEDGARMSADEMTRRQTECMPEIMKKYYFLSEWKKS